MSTDTGFVQTGATVVDFDNLAAGCGDAESTIDGNPTSGACLNGAFIVLEFTPTNTPLLRELWIRVIGATGTLSQGFGPLVFSLFDWDTNNFQEVKTYNEAVPEFIHPIEFEVEGDLTNLVNPDGTIRLKILSVQHSGTSARIREVFVRAIHNENLGIETSPLSIIDGIGSNYTAQLHAAQVDIVLELANIQPIPLSPVADLTVARLHEFQRKAQLAIDIGFARSVFHSVFTLTLKEIIEEKDLNLQNSTTLNLTEIAELKAGIATLFVVLDNAEVEDLPLSFFEAV